MKWAYGSCLTVHFAVRPNSTGVERTGTIVVGEARWTFKQDY